MVRNRLRVHGSPPRAWGQPGPDSRLERLPRFTPTRVGTTVSKAARKSLSAVHPHARGDNFRFLLRLPHQGGSPPRAWGQRHHGRPQPRCGRFTPTRVGTTTQIPRPSSAASVHPHARGDNAADILALGTTPGSPPRAWGQHMQRIQNHRRQRFTPTRVGTTGEPTSPPIVVTVHPHARGDNSGEVFLAPPGFGSPPRAWGQLPQVIERDGNLRFTPTRVGTTPASRRRPRPRPVHPHARGDNALPLGETKVSAGSPPRAWGQLDLAADLEARGRFTPTRVGTTSRCRSRAASGSVHPHARGDNY